MKIAGIPEDVKDAFAKLTGLESEYERCEALARNPGRDGKVTSLPNVPVAEGASTSSATGPIAVSEVFTAYLQVHREALFSSSIARYFVRNETWTLTLFAFLTLALSLGLLSGSLRLFGIARSRKSKDSMQEFSLPLATPVIAVVVVMLLTGFGTLFRSEIDAATSKFLMILVAAIAFSPEAFLVAIKRYVFDVMDDFGRDAGPG